MGNIPRLQFVTVCVMPLTLVLTKAKACYEWGNNNRVNHLLFMADLQLFGKDYNQIDYLAMVQTVHFVSSDIGIEFGIKNAVC